MSKFIVFDFEVFAHDVMLGALIVNDDGNIDVFQSWDIVKIARFYETNKRYYWIGHNIAGYDNHILEACVNGLDEEAIKALSDDIIRGNRWRKCKLDFMYYDLMNSKFYSLKSLEAYYGKAISETPVDFNLPRKLNDEEKRLTESYNLDDLDQTFDDFLALKNEFILRLDMIKEFHLSADALQMTGTQVAAAVLKAKHINGIENMRRPPVLWPNLQVENKDAINFYLSEDWKREEGKSAKRFTLNIGGCEFIVSSGGIHAAKKKYHAKRCLYCDVSGYYNLLMINLNLYPRTLPEEGKEKYIHLYKEQLRLKKIDPNKRGIFKTILLCVWGAMKQPHSDFYDPCTGDLLLLSGQMFLIDLCEKLSKKANIVQANTDGVIIEPHDGVTDAEIKSICDEWQDRTGFVLKFEEIFDIHQRDVNNYMYRNADNEIVTVGEAVTHYGKWIYPFWKDSYSAKEPIIISYAIVEYFMEHRLPEETIEKYKHNLRMFQYIPKRISFDWLEYEETHVPTNETSISPLQHINRAFAMKNDDVVGMIYKCKHDGKRAKVSNLPNSVFVYNDEILSDDAYKIVSDKIDWQYYIDRSYERIMPFIDIINAKGVNV